MAADFQFWSARIRVRGPPSGLSLCFNCHIINHRNHHVSICDWENSLFWFRNKIVYCFFFLQKSTKNQKKNLSSKTSFFAAFCLIFFNKKSSFFAALSFIFSFKKSLLFFFFAAFSLVCFSQKIVFLRGLFHFFFQKIIVFAVFSFTIPPSPTASFFAVSFPKRRFRELCLLFKGKIHICLLFGRD